MSGMTFLDLNSAFEIAEFPANYTDQQRTAALIYLSDVVKKIKEIEKNKKNSLKELENSKIHKKTNLFAV
jgi:hypothetical protein